MRSVPALLIAILSLTILFGSATIATAAPTMPVDRQVQPQAATLTVTSLADSGPGSLRQAIADAVSGDTIQFDQELTGTIMLTSGALTLSKDLTITGPGAAILAISGNNASRVFLIDRIVTINISGLTIRDGLNTSTASLNQGAGIDNRGGILEVADSVFVNNRSSSGGGAIANANRLTVRDSMFEGNTADAGGAIYSSVAMTLTNSIVRENLATEQGGGIYVLVGQAHITNSTIAENSVDENGGGGGGVMINDGTVVIENSQIIDNSAWTDGGGIRNYSRLTVNDTLIARNSAGKGGGGIAVIYFDGEPVTINNSAILDNTAESRGGAIIGVATIGEFPLLEISGSTLAGNTAGDNGDAISTSGALILTNSTVTNNISPIISSVISGSALTLISSTITGNSAGVSNNSGVITTTQSILAGNTGFDYEGGSEAEFVSGGYNLVGVVGDVPLSATDLQAIDPRLAPLADNGGTTGTRLPFTTSLALDAVPAAACATEIDQRGVARPQADACDIGAAEGSVEAPEPEQFFVYLPLLRR